MDALDAHIIATIVQTLGGSITVHAREGMVCLTLDERARQSLLLAEEHDESLDLWLELACSGLEADTLHLAGEEWAGEVELGIEVLVCERSAALHLVHQASDRGPLHFRDQHPAVVANACLPLPLMVRLAP